jgi:hypothetical protein
MTAVADLPDTDPRTGDDGLGWVTRAVFPDHGVRLALGPAGSDGAPVGWRRVARYAVVPSARRPRFLLPMGSRRVAAASLLAYNALRPVKVRTVRAVIGTLARIGALEAARMPRMTVCVPRGAPVADLVLAEHLAEVFGQGRLYAACGVRPPDPNHKPTLQLFDAEGRPRGYAKIGWNDATRRLVRAEAAALRALPRTGADHPIVPSLLFDGEWCGQALAVVEPLPADVRGVDPTEEPRLAAMLAVARQGGVPAPPRPLEGSPFLRRLETQAREAADATDPRTAQAGRRAVAAVRRFGLSYGTTEVEFGNWHGDWVPWNLGTHAGRLVAWDWEHSGPDVPVGFDLAHDAFQRALVSHGRPVADAARAADEQVARHAGRLGLGPEQCGLVVTGYLVEMWLRTWRLAAGGAGWNPALHPGLLDVVEKRHTG